jgi:branched-chain amino acid transport system permease protein
MGHAGFMSLGAYTSAILSMHYGCLSLGASRRRREMAALFGVIIAYLPSGCGVITWPW